MKYVILYGSESELIKNLFPVNKNYKIIKIYGAKMPENSKESINISGNSPHMLGEILNSLNSVEKGDEIIFIGAAFLSDNSLLVNLKNEELEKIMNINILSYVKLTLALLPIMVRIRSGNFIYLSSFRAINATKGAVIYSASKAFGENFFTGIAKEYGRFGIKCNSLRMGYFDGRILYSLGSEEAIEKVRKRSVLKRLGTVDDIRKAVKFCLDSPYTTGGIIDINGGLDFE